MMNDDLLMNDTFENLNFTDNHVTTKSFSDVLQKSLLQKEKCKNRETEIFFHNFTFPSQTLKEEKTTSTGMQENGAESILGEEKLKKPSQKLIERSKACKEIKPICDNKENTLLNDRKITNKHVIKNEVAKHQLSENHFSVENSPHMNKLSSWGLPETVLEKYESRSLKTMFSWQTECLSKVEVLKGKNLVYSAPTSAGKTLVAEILAIKTILEYKKKVIFILPFVSIVREKMYYFQDLLETSGIRVDGFMGSYNPPGGFKSVQFAICTIEKANSLINRLLEEEKLRDIGAVLIDEIHLLGDPSRGYLLELLLTKLRYVSKKDDLKIQIIGMSATLPNLNQIAKWLDAELYTTDFRPVPLNEQAQVCGDIYDKNMKLIRTLNLLPEIKSDTDNVLQLCLETIKESCSVLIFCPTKNWCENLAQQIATGFRKIGSSKSNWGELLHTQLDTNLIIELLGQLKYCPVGLDEVLRKTVSFGVAFHHAGLTMDERDVIESGFRNGTLRVLVATSTLSSGVNLPARRVIIRTPMFHGKPLDSLVYRQMIGRAGRMGKDSLGESFLICQKNDYKIAKELMSAELSPVKSCLKSAGKLKRAILEVVASGVANTPEDVQLFTQSTLLAVEDVCQELSNPIEEAVAFLQMNEFVRLQEEEDGSQKYVASSLGKACLCSSISPDEGLSLFTELEKARQCLVLETELHLIYLVTPYSACYSWENIDWMLYLNLWEKLPTNMKKVGELVGVRESYIVNATRGKIQTHTGKLYHKCLVHKRFFVALALQDLVNEKPLSWVCQKFNCNRGMLQSLQQSSSSFAGMVTAFSKQLGWSSIELLLSQFQERMQFGVSRDLLDLMHLPILNGKMARDLYNAGIETIIQLANSDISSIENILHRVGPFESEKDRDGESEYEKKRRNKYKNVWITGKEGLTEREAAEIFVTVARKYLKIEMGLVDAKWKESDKESEKKDDIANKHELDICSDINGDVSFNTSQNEDKTKSDSFFSDNSSVFSNNLSISDSSSISNADSTKIEDMEENNDYIDETSNRLSEKLVKCSLDSPKKKFSNKHFELSSTRFEKGIHSNGHTELKMLQESDNVCKEFEVKNNETPKDSRKVFKTKNNELTNLDKCVLESPKKDMTNNRADLPLHLPKNNFTDLTNTNLSKCTLDSPKKITSNIRTELTSKNIEQCIFESPKTVIRCSPTEFTPNLPRKLLTNGCTKLIDTNLNKFTVLTHENTEVNATELLHSSDTTAQTIDVKTILQEISLSDFSETLSENSTQTQSSKSVLTANPRVSEISEIINLPSVEFNISDSSVLNNVNISLDKTHSDQSLFEEDSFTLQLSENNSSNGSVLNQSKEHETDISPKIISTAGGLEKDENKITMEDESILQHAFRESFGSDDDIFGKSVGEDIFTVDKKRKCNSGGRGSTHKRLKTESEENIIQNEHVNESYAIHLLDDEKSADFSKMEIVNVCQELMILEAFSIELQQQECFSFSIACSKMEENRSVIGMNALRTHGVPSSDNPEDQKPAYHSDGRKLEGFSFCWENNVVYYLSLENTKLHQKIIKLLKSVFGNSATRVRMVDSKEQIKLLKKCCDLNFFCKLDDPKIADWILDPEGKEKNLKALAVRYSPESTELAQLSGGCKGVGSVGLDMYSSVPAKIRASLESVITWHLTDILKNMLEEENCKYMEAYDLETSILGCLAKIELDGINVNKSSFTTLLNTLKNQINSIEKQAYSLAGRKFNFVSSADVAKVIGMYRGKKMSTRKQILEKNPHPISDLVLQWRKLHSILTKTIYPLVQVIQNDRIHGSYITHTATGRISMHEPNLQNITKDFGIIDFITKENINISCRKAFEAPNDCILLSADYCQLELRILTHFSRDQLLCRIMREPEDVFKTIAAKWNHVSEEEVTDLIRQNAKHLCYGIIYGMGNMTLAEQLGIDETEAAEFMETFRNTYPGIKTFIKTTVDNCRKKGYVETLNGRRRYLLNINETDQTKKGQAERQAVNTVIQGSAADIVKRAMIRVESELEEMFHKTKSKPKMVLHLHDELIYEVPTKYLRKVAKILRKNMENYVNLSVPFPVKLKSGTCWGNMSELKL